MRAVSHPGTLTCSETLDSPPLMPQRSRSLAQEIEDVRRDAEAVLAHDKREARKRGVGLIEYRVNQRITQALPAIVDDIGLEMKFIDPEATAVYDKMEHCIELCVSGEKFFLPAHVCSRDIVLLSPKKRSRASVDAS